MTQNQLAFPDIDLLIDWLNNNPSYQNTMVRDIAQKSLKWNLSPKQIAVLQKAWTNIQSSGGQDPFQINLSRFPNLQTLS